MKKWQNCTIVRSVQSSLFFLRNMLINTGVKVESFSRPLTVLHIERLRPLSTHGLPFSCTCLAHRRLPSDGLMNHVANRIGNKLFPSVSMLKAYIGIEL